MIENVIELAGSLSPLLHRINLGDINYTHSTTTTAKITNNTTSDLSRCAYPICNTSTTTPAATTTTTTTTTTNSTTSANTTTSTATASTKIQNAGGDNKQYIPITHLTLKQCGACGQVSYCCIEHQKLDWKRHKHYCIQVKM